MNSQIVFVDRRKGGDRRADFDPCRNLEVDLFHRKRRKTRERRSQHRSLTDDYYAYMHAKLGNEPNRDSTGVNRLPD